MSPVHPCLACRAKPQDGPPSGLFRPSRATVVPENGVHEVREGCPDGRLIRQGVSTSLTSENKRRQQLLKAKKSSKTPLLTGRAWFRGRLMGVGWSSIENALRYTLGK